MQFGRGGLLWGRVCPFPLPTCLLPLAGDGTVCSWLALLWNCSVLPLFLSNAANFSPFSSHLLVADVSIWGIFLLGVAFRHVICGFYFFFLPVRLPSKIQKLPPDPPVRGFPGVWKLPLLRLPSLDGSPSLALLSLFIFYILSYLLSKTMGCFSGCLMSSASNQKLFCGVCSSNDLSMNFWGRKWSPHPIPPPS